MKNTEALIKYVKELAQMNGMGNVDISNTEESCLFNIEYGYATANIEVQDGKIILSVTRGKMDRNNTGDTYITNWSEEMPDYFSDCAKAAKFLKAARTSIDTFLRLTK